MNEIELIIAEEKTEPIKVSYQTDDREHEVIPIKKDEEIYDNNHIQNSEKPIKFHSSTAF